MTIRPLLVALHGLLGRLLEQPKEPAEILAPEEQERRAKNAERMGRRRSRMPWYQSRPIEFKVPDSLRYFEDLHGTRKTVEMLNKKAGGK